jgi:hypothetical protein
MQSESVIAIAKVNDIDNRTEIKTALFGILDKLKHTAKFSVPSSARIMVKVNLCLVKGYETGTTVDPYIGRCLAEWLIKEFDPEIIYIGEADATLLDVISIRDYI